MRIISQDGTIDIPYDKVVIQRFKSEIYFLNKNLTGVEGVVEDMRIAEYSSKEKAIKAMEMLHKAYTGMPVIFRNVEIDDSVKNMFSDLNKTGIILQSSADARPEVEYVNNTIFQFPKDDEVLE